MAVVYFAQLTVDNICGDRGRTLDCRTSTVTLSVTETLSSAANSAEDDH
jgi:hypothetical protein